MAYGRIVQYPEYRILRKKVLGKHSEQAEAMSPKKSFVYALPAFYWLILFATGCAAPPAGRVIVLGLEGMEPRVVDSLISKGKMPNFAWIQKEGAYCRLQCGRSATEEAPWITIATGKAPNQQSLDRLAAGEIEREKAVWNILSDAGKKVSVVGWPGMWPVETMNGATVSDRTFEIGLRLWQEERPDLLMVYSRPFKPDVEPAEEKDTYGTAVEQMYLHADRLVGKVIDDMERRARKMAESAKQLAGRGNLAAAMKLLDEAWRLAPRVVLVHQYRSNVATMMGDLETAIEALENASALVPDNELFRANLRRLKTEAAKKGS